MVLHIFTDPVISSWLFFHYYQQNFNTWLDFQLTKPQGCVVVVEYLNFVSNNKQSIHFFWLGGPKYMEDHGSGTPWFLWFGNPMVMALVRFEFKSLLFRVKCFVKRFHLCYNSHMNYIEISNEVDIWCVRSF